MNENIFDEIQRVRKAMSVSESILKCTDRLLKAYENFGIDAPVNRVKLLNVKHGEQTKVLAYRRRIDDLTKKL